MPGSCSMTDSSNTDWALSVTGPYESTAIVTGPMPRKPNATSPNANTAGATMIADSPSRGSVGSCGAPLAATRYAIPIRPAIVTPPIQNALKLPAVKPLSTLRDAPPSRLAVTTSRTCRERVDVNIVVISGITAPASVPQEMIVASFHHIVPSPARSGINRYDATYVQTIDRIDVNHTN